MLRCSSVQPATAAMDEGSTDQLVFFAFDLLYLNGESTAQPPLIQRKERLHRLFKKKIHGLRYSEHVVSYGPRFREYACKFGLEGVISKRIDRPYAPSDRGIWVQSKCLNRPPRKVASARRSSCRACTG